MWQPQPTIRIHGYRPPRSGPLLLRPAYMVIPADLEFLRCVCKTKRGISGKAGKWVHQTIENCLKVHFVMSPCFWDKIHDLSMYNTLFSSLDPRLGHHHCYLIPEHSNIPKRNPVPIKQSPPLFSFPHVYLLASEFLLKTKPLPCSNILTLEIRLSSLLQFCFWYLWLLFVCLATSRKCIWKIGILCHV